MNSLEDIVLSPAFAVILALVGAYLFVVISREFFLWYFKMNELNSKISRLDERLGEIEQAIQTLPSKIQSDKDLAELPPTTGLSAKESQFPLQH